MDPDFKIHTDKKIAQISEKDRPKRLIENHAACGTACIDLLKKYLNNQLIFL